MSWNPYYPTPSLPDKRKRRIDEAIQKSIVPVDVGEPPPPPSPTDNIDWAGMEKAFDASGQQVARGWRREAGEAPTLSDRGYPAPRSVADISATNKTTDAFPLPETVSGPPDRSGTYNPEDVFVGAKTAGLSPLERNLGKLGVLTDPSTSPDSKVRTDAQGNVIVEAPEKMPRWKSALLGALQGAMMSNATDNAGAISGLATGAVGGLISPKAVSEMMRRQEIARAEAELEPQMQIAGATVGLRNEQLKPEFQQQEINYKRDVLRQQAEERASEERGRNTRAGMTAAQREADRLSRQTEGEKNRRNQIKTAQIRSRSSSSRNDTRGAENKARRDSAVNAATRAETAAKDAEQKRAQADAQVSALSAELEKLPPPDPLAPDQFSSRRRLLMDQINRAQQESQFRQSEAEKYHQERDRQTAEAEKYPEDLDISPDERQLREEAAAAGLDPDEVVRRQRLRRGQ